MIIACCGLHIINPNESLVLTLFGNYYGTIKTPGFYYTNPFAFAVNPAGRAVTAAGTQTASAGGRKISTKVMTLNNEKQKVNDVLGNPIIIGAVVIWKVEEPVVLDEERKAAMVSNLLVVLCGNKDAQPIVNSGSIY